MANRQNINQIAVDIATMSKEDVKGELLQFNGRFNLDFTESYLNKLSGERLRHILLAAKLQQGVIN